MAAEGEVSAPKTGSFEGEAVPGVKHPVDHGQVFWLLGVMAGFLEMDQFILNCVAGTCLKGNPPTLIQGALGQRTC